MVTWFGAGSNLSFGRNQSNEAQVDLGSRVIQLTGAQIGVGGFCRAIARVGDQVRNSYQFSSVSGTGGWEYGTIQPGSQVASTC